MAKKHERDIIEILESYIQFYSDNLKSDLKQYSDEAAHYSLKRENRLVQKIIDYEFDVVGLSFKYHQIRMVKEELEILESLDTSVLKELAYILEINAFTFEDENDTYLLPWYINSFIADPILNAIIYIKKLERRKINWTNYRRDLEIFKRQLEKGIELTENFFHLIEVQSEDDILRTFLTRMYNLYLNIDCEGVRAIIYYIFPEGRRRFPKKQKEYMEKMQKELMELKKNDSNPKPYSNVLGKYVRQYK